MKHYMPFCKWQSVRQFTPNKALQPTHNPSLRYGLRSAELGR